MTTESSEDDNFASEEATQSIVSALGEDKRNKVLAGLYMGRCVCNIYYLFIYLFIYLFVCLFI